MIEETTTFSDLDDEYGQLIEQEIDNDIRDFMWKHGITRTVTTDCEEEQ